MMKGHPIRVYADTSVFGGVFDGKFADDSRLFFQQVREGRFRLVVSPLIADELARAPERVRALWTELSAEADLVRVTDEAVGLQAAYLSAGIVTPNYSDDALHVAVATVAACAAIVSWNFRHHVHFGKIPLYNAVNRINGFAELAIHSPNEVVENEDED